MNETANRPSCWNDIGTFGNQTCPELTVWAHCRNCPVYANAGRQLLDQKIPDSYREEWTALLAHEKETIQAEILSVIVFRLRDELLALKTAFFQEAADMASPHTIPLKTHEVFLGIVNINGELMLCMSVADLLGISAGDEQVQDRKVYARLVVIQRDGQRFAFPVDEVLGVYHFPLGSLQDLPATVSKSARALTAGIFHYEERKVGLIEEDKFFAALARSINT